jgi:WD40 repeat protein
MEEDDRRVKPHLSSFSSFVNHFQQRVFEGQTRERQVVQPHFAFFNKLNTPYGLRHTSPADAVCAHFVKKGLIRDRLGSSSLIKMTAACWSGNGKWLFCGLETGSYGLWEDEIFKVYKPIGVHVSRGASGEFEGTPIRAMAWSKHGDFIASGDEHGVIKIMNSRYALSIELQWVTTSPY